MVWCDVLQPLVAATWLRFHPFMSPYTHAYLAFLFISNAADFLWQRACRSTPQGGSFARWRELPEAGVRLAGCGFGAGCLLWATFLDRSPPPPDAASGIMAVARYMLLLLAASRLLTLLLCWCRLIRIRWVGSVERAGRQAGRQAGGRAGRQAGRQAGGWQGGPVV